MPKAGPKSIQTGTGTVRPAGPSDRDPADRLLEAVYAPHAGPADRTRMPRPPVPDDAARFVVERDGRLAGLATFGSTGGVLDWAVPAGPDSDGISAMLLEAGEAWVRDQGGTEILLYAPRDNSPSEALLTELGYRSVLPPHTVMQVVHFPILLTALADERIDLLRRLAPLSVALHLEPGLYPPLVEPDLLIRIGADRTTVTAETGDADVTVATTATRFSEFLFGARSSADFLSEAVNIEPADRSAAAASALEALAFGRPWFVPLGERR
jgi:GNAT superfamily N-acetyltransferase